MNLLGKGFAYKNEKIKGIRRADRFAKMAVSASGKACSENFFPRETSDVSIIVATMFGPHATTFKFLDNILDYSDKGASPTVFSHSVHNASASYIASALGIMGQTLTITCFQDPLKQALILAYAWLKSRQTEKVIVCYVDEESHPFCAFHEYCTFPSYSENMLKTGAAAVLLAGRDGEEGKRIQIPEKIIDPFTYITEL